MANCTMNNLDENKNKITVVVLNYNAGTWHFPLTSLGRPATFGLLMYMDGGPRDEDWHTLDAPIKLHVGAAD